VAWSSDGSPVDLAFKTYVSEPVAPTTVEFLPPLEQTPAAGAMVINEGSKSRTLPVKVRLFAGGSEITGANSPQAVVTLGQPAEVACSPTAESNGIDTDAAAGTTSTSTFSWSDDGFWHLNVRVEELALTPGSCYEHDIYLNGVRMTNAFAVYQPKTK
jgi:hypothetical protein